MFIKKNYIIYIVIVIFFLLFFLFFWLSLYNNQTKTTVLIDPTYPYIEEFKKKIVEDNQYEKFVFIDINSNKAKKILSWTKEKYTFTPIFLYWKNNPNVKLQKWKKYFYPKPEDLPIVHTVFINQKLITAFDVICKNLIIPWEWIHFLAIWKKWLYTLQKLYDDLKLLDKGVCLIDNNIIIPWVKNNIDETINTILKPGFYYIDRKEKKLFVIKKIFFK